MIVLHLIHHSRADEASISIVCGNISYKNNGTKPEMTAATLGKRRKLHRPIRWHINNGSGRYLLIVRCASHQEDNVRANRKMAQLPASPVPRLSIAGCLSCITKWLWRSILASAMSAISTNIGEHDVKSEQRSPINLMLLFRPISILRAIIFIKLR